MEQAGQAAARIPQEGGRIGHHPLHGEISHDLIAIKLHIARGEQVGIGNEHPPAPAGPGHSRPPGQSRTALAQAAGQLVEGPAVGQTAAKGGGGAEQRRQAPGQIFCVSRTHRGQHGQYQVAQQQQRADPVENPLGSVVHLNLTAEALCRARPLGIGVPAVPLSLILSHPVGAGRGRRHPAGQPLGAALMIPTVEQQEEICQHHNRIGEAQFLSRLQSQKDSIRQGKETGQGSQGVHFHLAPEGPANAGPQHIQ